MLVRAREHLLEDVLGVAGAQGIDAARDRVHVPREAIDQLAPPAADDFHDDDGHVVGAAVAVRGRDQLLADLLRIADVGDGRGHGALGHHLRQAVTAQQHVVAGLHRHFVQLDVHVPLATEGAQQDVLIFVLQGGLARQRPRFDLHLDERMIARQRLETPALPQIRAAVPDVGEADDVVREPRADDRRSHARLPRVALRRCPSCRPR